MLPSWMRNGRPVSLSIPSRTSTQLRLILLGLLFFALYVLVHPLGLTGFLPSRRATIYGSFTSSPYRIDKKLFLGPPALERPRYLPEPLSPKAKGMRVPNSLHYVYGLKPLREGQEGEELPYYAYLAMRSAMLNINPAAIYFHYDHLPTGPWWEMISQNLTLIKTEIPIAVYGRKLDHFAHKADVLRLLAMKHSGGIYLDVDMFITKPFDDLMYYSTTMGMEASPDSRRTELDPEGLCNAVIIAEPHSPFIDRWLAAYDTFDEGGWAQHSVQLPWALARHYPDEVQVLNSRAFFWPMWHGEEIQYTHERDDYDFYGTGQYAYHAWETLAMGYLEKLSPSYIRENDNSFNRLVRPFIGPNDDAVFAAWKPHPHT